MENPVHYFDSFCEVGPRQPKDPEAPWSTEDVLGWMDWCEIDGALVIHRLGVSHDPIEVRERLAEETAKAPGRLFPVWPAMPDDAGVFEPPDAFVAALRGADVRAVKLFPKTHRFPMHPDVLDPLLGALEEARVLTMLDMNEFPSMDETTTFRVCHDIASAHPNLPVLLQGFRWAYQNVIAALMARHPNVHLELSHLQSNRGIETYVARFGAERLLFGTALPAMSAGAARAYVDYADIDDETRRLIACGNLTRLTGLTPEPLAAADSEDAALRDTIRLGRPVTDSPVLDAHCHVLRDGADGAGAYVMYRGDAEHIVEIADRLGTQTTAMMSWGGPIGGDMRHDNDIVAAAVERFPGKVVGLAYVNPTHHAKEEIVAELTHRVDEQDFVGIKPYIHVGVPYDDALWAPSWEFGNARGLYALLHIGGKAGGTSNVANIAERYPDMKFLIAHSGGSWSMGRQVAALMKERPNVFAELTLTPVTNGVIEWLVHEVGDDRILYGTDSPMRDPRPQFGWVAWSRLPEETRRNILGRNFARLLDGVRKAKAAHGP